MKVELEAVSGSSGKPKDGLYQTQIGTVILIACWKQSDGEWYGTGIMFNKADTEKVSLVWNDNWRYNLLTPYRGKVILSDV